MAGDAAERLRWMRAISHPTRLGIVEHLLGVGEATPVALAEATGVPLGNIAYHVHRLREGGHIRLARETMVRGAVAHHYRLADRQATLEALRRAGLAVDEEPEPRPVLIDTPEAKRWQRLTRILAELRARREALGISREQLAEQLGIKPARLESIERGEADPRLTVLFSIADALDVSLAEIVDRATGAG